MAAHERPATPSDDISSAFLRLLARHECEIRAFVRSCLPRAADVDEVMQEVSLAAWRKFPSLKDRHLFPRWACLIAKYEILAFRRRHARDRLVFDEQLLSQIADEWTSEISIRQRELELLDACIAKLPRERREFLRAAYAPGVSIRDVAARLRRTEGSLYQLIARIREGLRRCVQDGLARE